MMLDRAALEGLRQMNLAGGTGQLAVGDLRADDLAGWPGRAAQRTCAVSLRPYNGPPTALTTTSWCGHLPASPSQR